MEAIYGEWRKIDSLCINCAIPLESRPAAWGLLVINGCEPMEYRHVEPHGCKNPAVYSGWNKYSEWEMANKGDCHDNTEYAAI